MFCIIIHVLSALYQYRKIHNGTLMDIKLKSANNPDLQTNADTVIKPTVLLFNISFLLFNIAQFTTAQILGVLCYIL